MNLSVSVYKFFLLKYESLIGINIFIIIIDIKLEAQELIHLVLQAKRKPTAQPQLSSVSLENSVELVLSQDFLHVIASDSSADADESTPLGDNTGEQLLKDVEAAVVLQATLILMWKV